MASRLPLCLALVLSMGKAALAESNIDPLASFAWAENAGWVNLRPDCLDGVQVGDSHVTGYAWGENTGWVYFGDGTNADASGVGVLNDGGTLAGYAWAENLGWINFQHFPTSGAYVSIDGSGQWFGYAWGENTGWINFNNGYGVRALPGGEGEGQGCVDIEGAADGEGEAGGEGTNEGGSEGIAEGEGEGALEGMGEGEGEAALPDHVQAANLLLQQFAALDTDSSGTLSYNEAYPVLTAVVSTKGFTEEFVLFSVFDTDHTNQVTTGELHWHASIHYLHMADTNGNHRLELSELLRVIQFYNAGALSCAFLGGADLDGYRADSFGTYGCPRASSDFQEPEWEVDLSELLRTIQLYSLGAYTYCPGSGTEDGYCEAP